MTFVNPILGHGCACWIPCREWKIIVLDRARKKASEFTNHKKDSEWETLAQLSTIARLYVLFKGYSMGRLWKLHATGCEGLTIYVGLIMFGKLGTGSKERVSRIIPSSIVQLKTRPNYLQRIVVFAPCMLIILVLYCPTKAHKLL